MGWRISEHWTDVWREEHAVDFTVARMASDSMVMDVHRQLVEALSIEHRDGAATYSGASAGGD